MKYNDLKTVKLPARPSKYGVGKLIGGQLYVHKKYEDEVADKIISKDALKKAKSKLDKGYTYTITKFDPATGNISFLQSPNWDTAPEPDVTFAYTVKPDGTVKTWKAPSSGVVYHHKWLFVKDDYAGFDVDESIKRSKYWMDVVAKNTIPYSKIGNKTFWETNVIPLL